LPARKLTRALTSPSPPAPPRPPALPVSIGFGIRTAEHAASIARLADGVVVGSALIDKIAEASSSADAVQGVFGLCRQLAEGVRNAR